MMVPNGKPIRRKRRKANQRKKEAGRRFVAEAGHLTAERDGKVVNSPGGSGRGPVKPFDGKPSRKTELSGGQWRATGGWAVDLAKGDHSSSTHPWPANKPGQNWIEKKGGHLPDFIKRVAKHIMADSGYTQSRAIAAAISQCKKGRLGAKGIAAAAQWERLKSS